MPQPNADSHAYGDSNCDADSNSHCDTDSDTHADANSDGNGDGDGHAYSYTYTDANADSHSDSHPYSYANTNANSHGNGHANTDANCNSHGYGNTDGNSHSAAEAYTDAEAAFDTAATSLALVENLKAGTRERKLASSPPEGGSTRSDRAGHFLKSDATARTLWQGVPATAEGNRTGSFRWFRAQSFRRCDCVIASLSIDGRLQKATPSAASLL